MNMEGWNIGKSDSESSISALSAVKTLIWGLICENEYSGK